MDLFHVLLLLHHPNYVSIAWITWNQLIQIFIVLFVPIFCQWRKFVTSEKDSSHCEWKENVGVQHILQSGEYDLQRILVYLCAILL